MVRQVKLEQAHAIFKSRRYATSKSTLLKLLECSDSTLKRIIRTLRDEYDAPLEYEADAGGYRYTDDRFELNAPGFWVSPHTLLTMVSMKQLLAQLRLDFLDQPLSELRQHIETCLKRQKLELTQLGRIHILPINARIHDHTQFQHITAAILQRQCLRIVYYSRGSDETSQRTVSPQRLSYYKDNWYLDAWCHLRQEMRIFALDGIQDVCH